MNKFNKFFAKKLMQTVLVFLFFAAGYNSGFAQAPTITPLDNPAEVVPMGDSLLFSLTLYNGGTALADFELEITVPAGFELLSSSPNFKAGSLSVDKLTGRLKFALAGGGSSPTITYYVKALCDAETATPLANRKIKYQMYSNATTMLGASKLIDNPIQNFYYPILLANAPAGKQIPLNQTETRSFALIQTLNHSHINGMQIIVTGDTSTMRISQVEVSKNGTTWITLPQGTAWTKNASGYTYTFTQANTFIPLGYLNQHLNYSDTLHVRETVTLLKCGSGLLEYAYYYGDGTTFCPAVAGVAEVDYTSPNVLYQPDIWQTAMRYPMGPDQDGSMVVHIQNKTPDTDANVFDMFVRWSGVSQWRFHKAYFTDAAGSPQYLNGDTVFIYLRNVNTATPDVMFDSCVATTPDLAAFYASQGLSCLNGDNKYNDLVKGALTHFKIMYSIELSLGTGNNCATTNYLYNGATYVGTLYYKDYCPGSAYRTYVRNYGGTDATNLWTGRMSLSNITEIAVKPSGNLVANQEGQLTLNPYSPDGNCTNNFGCGGSSDWILQMVRGTATYPHNADMKFYIVLPEGLSFKATPTTVPTFRMTDDKNPATYFDVVNNVWHNGYAFPTTEYTVSPTLDTICIIVTAANYANIQNNQFNIPVFSNHNSSDPASLDATKRAYMWAELDYGLTGTFRKFSCVNQYVPYTQIMDCTPWSLESMSVKRASFGYTNQTKSIQVMTIADAESRGFNLKLASPYDNVEASAKTVWTGASTLLNNIQELNFELIYPYASRVFDLRTDVEALEIFYNNYSTRVAYILNTGITVSQLAASGSLPVRQRMFVNLRPVLQGLLTGLNTNDSLRVVIHLRGNTNMPATIAEVAPTITISSRVNSTLVECTPLQSDLKIWNSTRGNITACSGGVTSCSPTNLYHNASNIAAAAFNHTVSWSLGAPIVNWTGGEYRPNIDSYDSVCVEYPMLIQITQVIAKQSLNYGSNVIPNNAVMSPSDYIIRYEAGKTFLTIKNGVTKDGMGTTSSTGLGYEIRYNIINPGASTDNRLIQTYLTTEFDDYPTSAVPLHRKYTRQSTSSQPNGGEVPYPYVYTISPVPASVSPSSTQAEWLLRLTNTSSWVATDANLPNSWVAVECPVGVTPVSMRDATSNTVFPAPFVEYAPNKYWIQLGNLVANPNYDMILSCTYTVCAGKPAMVVKYGMSKVDYPADPTGYSNYESPNIIKGVVTTNISFTPPVIDFAAYLEHTPNEAGAKNRFCDTIGFMGSYTNALNSYINGLQLRMPLPSGFEYFSGVTPVVKFGNGAWHAAQSVSTAGGILLITLDDSEELKSYGAALNADKAWVRFVLRMVCGIDNGSQPEAEFIGHSGCGASKIRKQVTAAAIRIAGLQAPPEYDILDLVLTQNPFTGGAGGDGTMELSGKYRLTQAPSSDVKAIIDLPHNLVLDTVLMPSIAFTQSGRRLIADLPSVAAIGAEYPFHMILRPTNPAEWTMDSVYIYIRTGKINILTCDGIQCPVLELSTKYDSVTVSMLKIEVCFSDEITATSRYGDAQSERVVVSGWLVNSGIMDAGRLTMDWTYFDGVDFVPVSGVMSSLTISNILHNDSVAFTIQANVPYSQNVCNMWLLLRKHYTENGALNSYLADSCAIAIPIPIYSILNQPDPICQLSGNTMIGDLPIVDYHYLWTPSTHLLRDNQTQASFSFDYENYHQWNDTILEYFVDVIRPNGCITTDTVFVPVKGMPDVQDMNDTTICSNSAYRIDFYDDHNPLGNTTFSWTISNGPSVSMPASGTTPYINVAQVRNTGTQPVVLQVQVTPKKSNCTGITKTYFITVNPKPRTNYVPDQIFCAGQIVGSQTISGDNSAAMYYWEFVTGENILGAPAATPPTNGISIIPNFIANNPGSANRQGNYRAFAAYDNAGRVCYSDTINFTMDIEPMPSVVLNPVGDRNLCSGGNLNVAFVTAPAGTTVSWQKTSGQNIPGLATNGSANPIVLNNIQNLGSTPIQAVYSVTPISASGRCMGGTDNFIISINPYPSIQGLHDFTICSDDNFNYTLSSLVSGVGFTWERLANANINGNDGGRTGSGSLINEVLTSSSASNVTVMYKVLLSANGCDKLDTIRVTVKPQPRLTSSLTPAGICSDAAFVYTPAVNVTGTAVTWERLDNVSIAQPGNSGSGLTAINQVLTNIGTAPTTVVYRFTMSATGCTNEQDVRVVVQPKPVLSSNLTPNAICSGSTFAYTARSSTSGVTFAWSRQAAAGITSVPVATTGTGNSISQTLTNSTTAAITVKYDITMTINGCSNTETVEVVVNPIPVLSSALTNGQICSGDYHVYNISSATSGASFTWRRIANANISQAVTNGVTALISEPLTIIDGVSLQQTVTYNIVTSANGCTNTAGQNVTVLVNPLPTLNVLPATVNMSAGDVIQLAATSNAAASGLTWVSGNTGVATITPATNSLTPTLTAVTQGTTYITATMTNANGCIRSQQILVNVGPSNVAAIALASGYPSEICNGSNTRLNISVTGGDLPYRVKYKWRIGTAAWNYVTLNNLSSSTNITVSPANATANVINVEYAIDSVWTNTNQFVTPLPGTVIIQVSPSVTVNAITPNPQVVCEGSMLNVPAFTSTFTGITYEWQNSNPAINLSLSGVGNLPAFMAQNGSGAVMTSNVQVRGVTVNGAATCPGAWQNFSIQVNPKPSFSVVLPAAICQGDSVRLTQATNATNISPSTGVTVSFYTDLACTSPIAASGWVKPSTTTTYYARATTAASCLSDVQSITVTVKPLPQLSSPTAVSLCSGERLDYTATSSLSGGVSYTWSHPAVSGILANSGQGAQIRETLISTAVTAVVVPYAVTLTAESCSTTTTVNVTVNPKPSVTNIPVNTVQCSGETFAFTPAVNVASATYTWERLSANGIEEAESQGSNVAINEILTNSNTTSVVVRYNITTETSAGCSNLQELRLTVGPNPTLSSNLYPNPICSGSLFTYSARSRTPNVIFSWRRQANPSITPAATVAWNAGNAISETLSNTSSNQQTVIYEIRMQYVLDASTTCENIEFVELQVNPSPSLTSSLATDTICSGDYFSYTLTSATPGVNYMWNRPRVTGISQQMGFGTTPYIAEMLTNTTQLPITVSYNFTIEANGCSTTGLTKNVLVNPVPLVNITNASPVVLNVGGTDIVHAVTTATITSWHWESSNTSIVSITGGDATPNASISAQGMGTATLTVSATNALGACVGTASILINVGAAPTAILSLATGSPNEICNGGSTMLNVEIIGGSAPFTIIYNDGIQDDTAIFYSSPCQITVYPPLNTGTAVNEVHYTLTDVLYGASNISINHNGAAVIRVNPTVTVSTVLNNVTVCEGSVVSGQVFASPSDPRVNYAWTNDNPNIGLAVNGTGAIPSFIAQNPLGSAITADLEVTPTYRGTLSCPGTPSNWTITVNPKPTFNVVTPAPICANDSYTFTTASNISNLAPAGSTVTFYQDYACSIAVTTVSPAFTNTYFVRATSPDGCNSDVKEITVAVNERPQMTSSHQEAICSGDRFEYAITSDITASYNWTRQANAAINSGAVSAGGNANIRENLTNSSNLPVIVTYYITMTSQSCPTNDSLKVTVYPKPTLTSTVTTPICSGTNFSFTPSSNVGAAEITWERLDVSGILEAPSGGAGLEGLVINEVLTNTTTNPIQVSYNITVSKDGCSSTQQVRVTVKPMPELSSSTAGVSICSGATFSYNATSATRNTVFSWSRPAVAGNTASGPNASSVISEVLINNTLSPVTAVYSITMNYDGCITTDSILVTINPQVNITSTVTPADICSEDYFNYNITSNISDANFTWRRVANPNIQQAITSGSTYDIYEQLTIRNSTAQVPVTYIVRAESKGCMSVQTTVTVNVNPKPAVQMVTATPLQMAVNNTETVQGSTLVDVVGWVSSNVNVATVTQDGLDPTKAVVLAVGQGIAEITLSVVNPVTGCTNEVSFIVNVEAAHTAVLTLAANGSSEICSGSATILEATINGGHAPFTVVYTSDGGVTTDTILNVGSSVHRFTVNPPLNTTTTQQITTYQLVSVTESGPQAVTVIPTTVQITVNPVPNVTTVFATPYTYCEGDIVNNLPAFVADALPSNRVKYQWENNNPAIGLAMSGSTSAIAGFVAQNGQGITISSNITVTPYYQGMLTTCQGNPSTFQIIVNPKPDFTVVNPEPICYGDNVDLITNALVYVQNIIPTGSSIHFYYDRACLTEILTSVSPTYTTTYFVRLESIDNCYSAVKDITVTVKPLPQMTSAIAAAVCSGEVFEYQTTCDLTGVSYEWTRDAVVGVGNATTTGYGSVIRETLVNTTGAPIDVIYSIRMLSGGCTFTDTVTVTVNPMPVLNNIPAVLAICSEATFNYASPSSNVPTASIRWTRVDNGQIAEPGTSGTSSISETLTNLGSTPTTVTYEFILSNAGCERTELIRVVVNPTPMLSTALYAGSICSQTSFNYTARSATRGTTFTWERIPDVDITPAPTGITAGNIISEVLTNNSANPVIVYYDVTMTANGCSNTEIVEVTVNPLPQLDPTTLTSGDICSGDVFVFQLQSQTQNANFSWLRFGNPQIIEAPSFGNTLMISEVLTNRGTTQTEVVYKVITEANGCRNSGDTIRVNVNALPQVSIISATPVNVTVNNNRTVIASIPAGCIALWESSNTAVATVTMDGADQTKAVVHGYFQGISYGSVSVTDTLTGCTNKVSFTINVDAEQIAQLVVPTGYVPQVCSGDYTLLATTMSGGSIPFIFEYTDGLTIYTDTAYQGIYSFTIYPPVNITNAAINTTYTLLSVIDGTGQTLTIGGHPVVITTNPVATVSNIALLSDTICEGLLERILPFATNVTPSSRVRYQWENDNPNIGLGFAGNGNIPVFISANGFGDAITGYVTVYPVYSDLLSCPGTPATFNITVEAKPDFTVIDPYPICSGTSFDFVLESANIAQGVTPSGCTVKYYTERSCINEVTVVTPTRSTIYYVQVTSPAGCLSLVKPVILGVNNVPTVDTILDQMVCNLDPINITITGAYPNTMYRWEKTGVINSNIVGLPASGTSFIIASHLRNNTPDVQSQEITITPELLVGGDICVGDPVSFLILVNPTPVLSSPTVLPAICSGVKLIHTPTTLTAGASIHWGRELNTGIEEAPTSGTGTIEENLTNLTNQVILVRYLVTLEINGCSNQEYITIRVYPKPVLSSTVNPGIICSGDNFNYIASSAVRDVTFSWERLANASIAEAVTNGYGNIISEQLTNLTYFPTAVQYEITMTANGCSNMEVVTVYVAPKLGLSSTLTPPDICSGEYFIYFATSNAAVTYAWDRVFNPNIDAPTNNGIGSRITERLYNLSNVPQPIIYYITMTTAEGCHLTEQITFNVNPLPPIVVSENPITIAQGATRLITVTEPAPANGSITSSNTSVVTATLDGLGGITITAVTAGYGELTYSTYDAASGCQNEVVIPVTVTPGPLGTLTSIGATTLCSADSVDLQITDILYGKAPWTVEINYAGSTDPATVVVVNNLMDLPAIVNIHVPQNTTLTTKVFTYYITKITDGEGSVRTSHIGRILITVAPEPTVDFVADQEICNMSSSETVFFTGAATDFRWTVSTAVGFPLYGEGNLLSTLLSHNQPVAVDALVTVTPVYVLGTLTCVGVNPGTFTITVNPMPKADLQADVVICHDGVVDLPITGVASTKFICSTMTSIGMANSVTVNAGGNLTFTAQNTSNTPVTATITVLPVYESATQECYGVPITFTITVNPIPTIYPTQDMVFCASATVNAINFTGNVQGSVYHWNKIAGEPITGLQDSGINQIPSFIAYNLLDTTITNTFVVRASYTNQGVTCSLYSDTFDIRIYPTPSIEPILDVEYCAQVLTDSIAFIGNSSLNIYDWRIVNGPNIGLPSTSGTGLGISPFTTFNDNSYSRVAEFEVVPRIDGTTCIGSPIYFHITVKPVAILSSALENDTLCSGETFSYNATSTTDNVFYKWRRPAIGGMDSIGGQGNFIQHHVYNNTDAPIAVQYIFTLTYQDCDNDDTTVVYVNPTPSIVLDSAYFHACQGDATVDITYTTDRPNLPLEYSIVFEDAARAAGFMNTVSYQAVTTSGIITVNIPAGVPAGYYMGTIYIRSYGCMAVESYSFMILVAQKTVITEQPISEVVLCEGFGLLHLQVTAIGENVVYQWYINGLPIPGATNSVYEVDLPTIDDYGDYYVVASGVCGEDTSNVIHVIKNFVEVGVMWDDVLYVSNKDTNHIGLEFAYYQWYKWSDASNRFVPIHFSSESQLYHDPDGLNGTYVVELFWKNGMSVMSCPITYTPSNVSPIQSLLYPNPSIAHETFFVRIGNDIVKEVDYSKITIELTNLLGEIITRLVPSGEITEIRAQLAPAVYTVKVRTNTGTILLSTKLVVK